MKKRILALALALVLALAFVPSALAVTHVMIIPYAYEDADYFSEGLAAVKLDGKWGYIDTTGNEVIPFQYDYAGGFYNGEAYVEIGEGDSAKIYFIDKTGKVVEELTLEEPGDPGEEEYYFSEGLLATQDGKWDNNGKYGFVDEDWNTVIEPKYDDAYNFDDGLAKVKIDGQWGCIDRTGKVIVPIEYDWVDRFSEGFAVVGLNSMCGYVDKTGKLAIPLEYRDAYRFSEGLAPVLFGDNATGKYGFIDTAGKVIIPGAFDSVGYYGFSEGLVAVRRGDYFNGKWGFAAVSLAGASDWAIPELASALESDIILHEMIGKWAQPTSRELAAQAIVRLIEAIKGKHFLMLVEDYDFDMDDTFSDTDNEEITFLKAAGISNGVDGVKYDPNGTFTRAQMVTMLGRMATVFCDVDMGDFQKGSATFTDVPAWADEFVGWAVAAKVTNGVSSSLFDSNGVLTNQHTGVFAFRALSHFAMG